MKRNNEYRFKRKPGRCPVCGGKRIANILYGLPDFSGKLERDVEEGKIVLGGCCINGDDPEWMCVECSAVLYRVS